MTLVNTLNNSVNQGRFSVLLSITACLEKVLALLFGWLVKHFYAYGLCYFKLSLIKTPLTHKKTNTKK